ncbi:MAG TPA: thioredoxin domain-containing protein [Candidatus Paceibacterota bacterium]
MLKTLSVPIAIVIAGALIAASLYFVNRDRQATVPPEEASVAEEIRGVQENDHVLGNPNAEIVIVEFSDTECPFCQRFHETMHQIIEEYGLNGNVAWVYRHFPIPQLHPKAPKEAEALECAAELGGTGAFWKYTDMLYETTPTNNGLNIGIYNEPKQAGEKTGAGQLTEIAIAVGLDADPFETCLKSGKHAARIQKDTSEAVAAGGRGTPHSIMLVDGEQIPIEGAQPYEVVKGLIDAAL